MSPDRSRRRSPGIDLAVWDLYARRREIAVVEIARRQRQPDQGLRQRHQSDRLATDGGSGAGSWASRAEAEDWLRACERSRQSRIASWPRRRRHAGRRRQPGLVVADEVEPLKAAYAETYARARTLTRELDDLRGAGRDRERELDMLRYQVHEIEAADVEPGEDERLALVDRERARHAGKLLERSGGALALLAGESEAAALDGVRVAQRLVAEAALLDESVAPLADRLGALTAELDDLAAALRDYIDALDVDAAHRDGLELRHDKLKGLMRKYGGSADEVLAYLEEARARLLALEEFAADEESLVATVTAAQDEAVAAAARLGEARRRLAPRVAARIEEELRGLAMPHATFVIAVTARGGGWDGLGPSGADEVEFVFGANPGCRRARCARPRRGASSRARCSPSVGW